jgi:hypothetical protein
VIRDEYAVSPDGMRMFDALALETAFNGCRFTIGIRNANDKSMRLGLTAGLRVLVCSNLAFQGDFTPGLAKHLKNRRTRTSHLATCALSNAFTSALKSLDPIPLFQATARLGAYFQANN